MSSPDVFISYNREDAAIAQVYADSLTSAGLTVWWDATLRSGEDYDAVTEQSLRTAKAVVVLWSPRSVNSRWVRAEATIADRGHTLMPVMIEPCDRPVMFELKQTVELSHWRGDLEDKDWLAFVADLRHKTGRAAPDPVAATEVAEGPRSGPGSGGRSAVAVLPVSCRGGDGALEVLAEDLTEDITRELAHNGQFRVIAAGSMAAWRGKSIDHKDVARQLEARYLVEGKLQRGGKDTRLTAQLIDGASGNVLWSTRLVTDTDGGEFSADTMSVAAATQIAEQIVQREQVRAMAKRAPFSPWDHIFRAAAYSQRDDRNSARQAVEEAQLAVTAAPEIGVARAVLASALAALPESLGVKPDAEQIREIQAQTRQAMRLDGNNPSVMIALAGAYKGLGEYEICLRLARRTVELWPSSPVSYLILGNSYRLLGRNAEAVDAYRKQDQLSPFDANRYVALTCLGECLLAEGQAEAAEDALDRALMLDPEYPAALEWKAITADQLGKAQVAHDVMRQIRAAEAAVPLDSHVWQIERDEHLGDRGAAYVATLRRLWLAIDGPAAAPAVIADQAAPIEAPVAEPVFAEEETTAQTEAALLVEEPAAPAPVVALEPSKAAEPSAIPLTPAKPRAKRSGSAPPDKGAGDPPAEKSVAVPGDAYLISPAAKGAVPTGQPKSPANDDAGAGAAKRSFALPRVAAFVGAIALVGAGGAMWLSRGNPDKLISAAPTAALAELGVDAPVGTDAAEVPAAAVPGAAQPLTQAMAALITASRNAGRPQAEIAALVAGQQRLSALLAQSAADPANGELTAQLNAIAADIVRQQGAKLSGDADRWLRGQEQAAAAAKRSLTPDAAATIDRALGRARAAKADLASAVAAATRASDATRALNAARTAVAAYGRMVASAGPVAAAVASARAAEAEANKLKARLSRAHAEIDTTRADVGRLAGQVAGLAAIEKPGLFASGNKKQSHKLRKANAERARALAAEADRLAASSASLNDIGALEANLSRLRSLRSQVSELLAGSNAALKALEKPDKKAAPTDKK
jgi:TolB-like protein